MEKIRWTIFNDRNGMKWASNYETTLSILEFQARKMEASPKRPSNAPAPVSSGELGTRHTLRRPGRLDNVGQRPTEAAESRRPTPPVSSLPPCFPNSKGLHQDHQVISIPKFAKAGKCDQIDSKVSTKTYSVIHCGLSG